MASRRGKRDTTETAVFVAGVVYALIVIVAGVTS